MTNELRDRHVRWAKVAEIDVRAIERADDLAAWIVNNRYHLADLELQSPPHSAALRTVLHDQSEKISARIRQGVG